MATKLDTRPSKGEAKIGPVTHVDPTKTDAQSRRLAIVANKAERARLETIAAESNAKTLAAKQANAKPAPAPKLAKGSGALVGVAQGAMDGQPHTRLAVEQKRRELRAAASPTPSPLTPAEHKARKTPSAGAIKCVEVAPGGKGAVNIWVPARNAAWIVGGRYYDNAELAAQRHAADARERAGAVKVEAPAMPRQPKGAAPSTPKPAKAPAAPRQPKAGAQAIAIVNPAFVFGAAGTARNKAWLACLASKTTAEYATKGGPAKYLPRWAAAGALRLG